jgi:hypothetical protein
VDSPTPARKRQVSGSERRRSRAMLPPVRCSAEQRAAVEDAAQRAGLSVGSYVLATVLKSPPPRGGRRVPQVEKAAIAQILAQAGRIAGNTNQIAKRVNLGGFPEGIEFLAAAKELAGLRDDIRAALGRGRRDHQG